MKKNYFYSIEGIESDDFLTHNKNTKDYAKIVLLIARKIITTQAQNIDINKEIKPFILIKKDKQSRAFVFASANKYFSIAFPFNIKIGEKGLLQVYSREKQIELTNKLISECISIINSISSNGTFLDAWLDSRCEQTVADIVELLFHTEPCYLRYDYDENASRGRERIHPKHHLDINMNKIGTYKIGLYKKITRIQFINIVEDKEECYFLSQYKHENGTLSFKKWK